MKILTFIVLTLVIMFLIIQGLMLLVHFFLSFTPFFIIFIILYLTYEWICSLFKKKDLEC